MTNPIIADNKPHPAALKKGEEYYFCICGRSAKQPFCDGAHRGTNFTPKAFTADEDGDAYLCHCKHTKNPPFCDGSHKSFGADLVGKEGPGVSDGEDAAVEPTEEEPHVAFIHQLAREGLSKLGHHGPMAAMGVPAKDLPKWDDIQIMVAQLDRKPLLEDQEVATELVVGPEAKKPLSLKIPLFVSDMSFGALSEEAKVSMARGAELAGTGICSGEGGMLPDEQEANSRYFYELASAKFGYKEELLERVQAFHFKAGQGAKTGTGGHLPGAKNVGRISEVRGIPEGQPAVSPPTFSDLNTPEEYARFADRVREVSGGIPIGFKLSANHIERDIGFALKAGADYVILDARGGGTGSAPLLFRDHISVPGIPALARARRFLDSEGASGRVTLIATGGLRVPSDFIKAMALGADGIAVSNSAMQAIGCVAARICNTNNCPAGIATQKKDLRQKLNVAKSSLQLANFFNASVELMQVMARACGHSSLSEFSLDDLATWDRELSQLSGISYSGIR
ncbi:glutamate synthase-related protein [Pelagicoccus mobilis]|uniref:CDGSH iron-sulfur domain-containing protein n=1 Tax=Pelagicoccus mobilis TaxID=415221 RepID=A0A934VRD9_9BACT|nr:glutamate synthase-related protein [Pelagicoccus mobilis]MBK1877523.1 CDGSH iron-sulfur domain-containing protein [Pelagicoccus mobilis]